MSIVPLVNDVYVPAYHELMWPTLKALKALGGSATNQELLDKIIELENFPEDVQKYSPDGRHIKLETNCSWARSYLKKYGAINNSTMGTWIILDKGEEIKQGDIDSICTQVKKISHEERREKTLLEKEKQEKRIARAEMKNSANINGIEEAIEVDTEEEDWKDQLLSTLHKIHPSAFERLCQLVLRESGFIKVEVTGKTGDGGIDGIGILRVNLLSFHVSFQCKRYQGSVGSPEIRDFRGAMIGRGDKGLFITTGHFTSDARTEASRDGAPAIDLIDGNDLCALLKNLKLGVNTTTIEHVSIDRDWFTQI